jgi:N-methylhydantoinase B
MSNTLNTPVEAFEQEYPMRVERFELAYGTGGAGRFPGGDGIVRAIRVLEPASLSLLTDRRRHRPAGRDGGGAGACGHNQLNGEPLPAKVSLSLATDDVVTIITPGGGGYGASGV